MHMMSDGILARKILLITRVNTILGHTILLSALGIYMRLIFPLVLLRAIRPSTLKGCVGSLPKGYVRSVPLPRGLLRQSAQSRQVHTIPDYYNAPYVVPTYDTPCSLVESAAYAFSPTWHAIAINT
jgi:hypothetical protein